MRKLTFIRFYFPLLFLTLIFGSCQNSKNSQKISDPESWEVIAEDEIFTGELTFTPEAAVFVGSSFIFGVEINDAAKELAEKVEAVKTDIHDIVPVTVRGNLKQKPEGQEGWDEILTITHIIDVSDTPKRPDIKL